ncbi:MAG: CXXX repeat peptide modification system protein [Clostridiales bacterium]|jgi:CXXX repeat modification system protein|nr:CXXX repeat peptide modification system protein [Clostridiales bacterium]
MNRVACDLTNEELKYIQELFERKIALENLAKLPDVLNSSLYEKFVADYGKTTRLFQKWWDDINEKYELKNLRCYVDFEGSKIMIEE